MSRVVPVLLLGLALLSPATTTETVVMTMAVLVVAAAIGTRSRPLLLPLGLGGIAPVPVRAEPRATLSRVTDPAHHPIAPRAPGRR